MSKQDDHFFNVFSAVIGILVAVTVALFVLSRMLGAGDSVDDPLLQAEVADRTAAVGRVAVAFQHARLQLLRPGVGEMELPPGATFDPDPQSQASANGA